MRLTKNFLVGPTDKGVESGLKRQDGCKGVIRTIIGLSVFCGLVILPLVVSPKDIFEVELGRELTTVFSLSAILYSALRLAIEATEKTTRVIAIGFWIYAYVFLAFTPYLQLQTGIFAWGGHYRDDEFWFAYLVIIMGLIAFDIGALSSKISLVSVTRPGADNPSSGRLISAGRARIILIFSVFLIAGAIAFAGFEAFFVSRDERLKLLVALVGGEGQVALQFAQSLLTVPPFAAFLCLLATTITERRALGKVGFWNQCWIALAALLCLLVNNPIGTARYWFGTIILGTAFYIWRVRRLAPGSLVIGMLVLLLIVFPFADAFRSEVSFMGSKEAQELGFVFHFTQKGDFDSFQQVVNSVRYVNEMGLSFGYQLLGTLLFWFPRLLWDGKPVASGMMVAEHMGYGFTNLSLPLWGELLLDGGIPLVVLAFFLYGYFAHKVESAAGNAGSKEGRELRDVLIPVFAAYQIFLLRGTLMSAFAYFAPVVLTFIVLTTSRKNVMKKVFRQSVVQKVG